VAFVFLLREARIDALMYVRAYPVSRRHPQFSREALAASLSQVGIAYDWQGKALGGMRAGGYAKHMETPAFTAAARALIVAAREARVCVMCAETDSGALPSLPYLGLARNPRRARDAPSRTGKNSRARRAALLKPAQ
jgi:hypothetical protein